MDNQSSKIVSNMIGSINLILMAVNKYLGVNYEINKLQPISTSLDNLSKQLLAIEEGGSTALGPAMAVCIGIASSSSDSSIILCTDGLSNVGVGSLESGDKNEQTEFYKNLGQLAKSKKSYYISYWYSRYR